MRKSALTGIVVLAFLGLALATSSVATQEISPDQLVAVRDVWIFNGLDELEAEEILRAARMEFHFIDSETLEDLEDADFEAKLQYLKSRVFAFRNFGSGDKEYLQAEMVVSRTPPHRVVGYIIFWRPLR